MRLPWLILLLFFTVGCQPAVQPSAPDAPSRAATAQPEPTSRSLTGKVVNVADGDTLSIRADGAEHRIRLHGVDCPEDGIPGTRTESGRLGSFLQTARFLGTFPFFRRLPISVRVPGT